MPTDATTAKNDAHLVTVGGLNTVYENIREICTNLDERIDAIGQLYTFKGDKNTWSTFCTAVSTGTIAQGDAYLVKEGYPEYSKDKDQFPAWASGFPSRMFICHNGYTNVSISDGLDDHGWETYWMPVDLHLNFASSTQYGIVRTGNSNIPASGIYAVRVDNNDDHDLEVYIPAPDNSTGYGVIKTNFTPVINEKHQVKVDNGSAYTDIKIVTSTIAGKVRVASSNYNPADASTYVDVDIAGWSNDSVQNAVLTTPPDAQSGYVVDKGSDSLPVYVGDTTGRVIHTIKKLYLSEASTTTNADEYELAKFENEKASPTKSTVKIKGKDVGDTGTTAALEVTGGIYATGKVKSGSLNTGAINSGAITSSGDISTTNGAILATGDISTSGGGIKVTAGNGGVSTVSGDITTTSGNITTTNGGVSGKTVTSTTTISADTDITYKGKLSSNSASTDSVKAEFTNSASGASNSTVKITGKAIGDNVTTASLEVAGGIYASNGTTDSTIAKFVNGASNKTNPTVVISGMNLDTTNSKGALNVTGGIYSSEKIKANTELISGGSITAGTSISAKGQITTTTGKLHTDNGEISTTSGAIYTTAGNIYTTTGNIYTSNGYVSAVGDIYTNSDTGKFYNSNKKDAVKAQFINNGTTTGSGSEASTTWSNNTVEITGANVTASTDTTAALKVTGGIIASGVKAGNIYGASLNGSSLNTTGNITSEATVKGATITSTGNITATGDSSKISISNDKNFVKAEFKNINATPTANTVEIQGKDVSTDNNNITTAALKIDGGIYATKNTDSTIAKFVNPGSGSTPNSYSNNTVIIEGRDITASTDTTAALKVTGGIIASGVKAGNIYNTSLTATGAIQGATVSGGTVSSTGSISANNDIYYSGKLYSNSDSTDSVKAQFTNNGNPSNTWSKATVEIKGAGVNISSDYSQSNAALKVDGGIYASKTIDSTIASFTNYGTTSGGTTTKNKSTVDINGKDVSDIGGGVITAALNVTGGIHATKTIKSDLKLEVSNSTANTVKAEFENTNATPTASTVVILGKDVDTTHANAALKVNGGIYATQTIHSAVSHTVLGNDITDAIAVPDDCDIKPGCCYYFDGNEYRKTDKYCQKGIIGIHSDTASSSLGKRGKGKELDISIGGFVLAYVDDVYKTGTPLTATKGGKLTKMKLIDRILHPERLVATYWKPELEEEWEYGPKTVEVNGRVWVKVK